MGFGIQQVTRKERQLPVGRDPLRDVSDTSILHPPNLALIREQMQKRSQQHRLA
jgi:hypothetical protein